MAIDEAQRSPRNNNIVQFQLAAAQRFGGSGGVGETPQLLLHILANRACTERRSRCPTGAGVGRILQYSNTSIGHGIYR